VLDLRDIKSGLDQFSGSETFTQHALNPRIVMTEGVVWLRESADCYWLVDAIVSHQLNAKVRVEEFQVWKLRRIPQGVSFSIRTSDGVSVGLSGKLWSAVLTVADGNSEDAIINQPIEHTDFPLDEITLWLVNNTLMLPGEY
jgi:hypothetical protein